MLVFSSGCTHTGFVSVYLELIDGKSDRACLPDKGHWMPFMEVLPGARKLLLMAAHSTVIQSYPSDLLPNLHTVRTGHI